MEVQDMLKHIRDAVRMAGLAPGAVEYHRGKRHPYLVVNGKRIIVSASPKEYDNAIKNIARDIERAMA